MTVHIKQEDSSQDIPRDSGSFNEYQTERITVDRPFGLDGRKWSTFLQKPDNPIPKPKVRFQEPENIKQAEPYRVVIKKQKRRRYPGCDATPDHLPVEEHGVTSVSLDHSEETESHAESDTEENGTSEHEKPENVENLEETSELSIEENGGQEDQNDEDLERQSPISCDSQNDDKPEETEEAVPSLTLEEQLAEVQKQLLLLSQMPSSVQDTLNLVTRQLTEIVSKNFEGSRPTSTDIREDENQDNDCEDENIENENDLGDEGKETIEEAYEDSLEGEAKCEDETDDEIVSNRSGQTEDETKENGQREEVDDEKSQNEEQLEETEEEKEALEREKEKLEKQERVNRLNQVWPWSDEKRPVYRINFMKYQPPPKNLDYLQRSEVYRLVHDMEPPVRGISTRMEKVLAEEDYYNKLSKEAQ